MHEAWGMGELGGNHSRSEEAGERPLRACGGTRGETQSGGCFTEATLAVEWEADSAGDQAGQAGAGAGFCTAALVWEKEKDT